MAKPKFKYPNKIITKYKQGLCSLLDEVNIQWIGISDDRIEFTVKNENQLILLSSRLNNHS